MSPKIHADPRTMDPDTTLKQITTGGLMTVGASAIRYTDDVLIMDARIHPVLKSGKRGAAARVMQISISLGHDDLYRISVSYLDRKTFQFVTHWESDGLYADMLAHTFVALDSGTETR